MPILRLNPALDPEKFAAIYAERKVVQVPDLFEPDVANALAQAVESLPWRLVWQDDDYKIHLSSKDDLVAMSADDRRRMSQGIFKRAADNLGFTYFMYPMIEAIIEGRDPGHPIHDLTVFLNSPEFLDFARKIIRVHGLTKIDAHASAYQPGHYLTRHIDEGDNQERRAAYTIGFSKRWEPDWGGLLLFLDGNLDIERGFTPRFNALTVFDGLQVHTVSAIAPFAPQMRYSIAGWFRDDRIGVKD